MDNTSEMLASRLFLIFLINFFQCPQSFTLRSDSKSPGCAQKSCSRSAAPTPPKRRSSVLWSEMLDVNTKESLSTKEIKRQEVTARGKRDWEQQHRAAFCPFPAGKGGTALGRGLHLPVHLKSGLMSASAMGKGGFHSGIPSEMPNFPRHS